MSHLNVSYVSQASAAAPARAPANVAPAADDPLGFLAALLDQVLAGSPLPLEASAAGEASAAIAVPRLPKAALNQLQARVESGVRSPPADLPQLSQAVDTLIAALDAGPVQPATTSTAGPVGPRFTHTTAATTLAAIISPEQIAPLLTDLGLDIAPLPDRLTALALSVSATDPDLAHKLDTLATRLARAADPVMEARLGFAPPSDPDAHAIADIIRALLGHGARPATPAPSSAAPAGDPAATAAADPAPPVHDDLLAILAGLGLNATPAAGTTAASTNVEAAGATSQTTSVPQPLLRLSTQLSRVATELATSSPELSGKLEAVATRLLSVDVDANLNGKITSAAAQANGATLDRLVQNLIEAGPITAPGPAAAASLAAPRNLPVPAPLAPKPSKAAIIGVQAGVTESAPVTADAAPGSTPRVDVAAAAEPASDNTPDPKVEARAAAVAAETAMSDPTTPAQTAQPQQLPAAVAPQARPLPAAYQPVANPINMGQVAFEMLRQVHQGTSRFTLRLDPPELGRVDVKMQVDRSGAVTARLTVDRAETLDLFQRDRQSLERALAQAGLDTGKANLEFSMRQQPHNPFAGMMGGDPRQQNSGDGSAARFRLADDDETAALPAVTLYRGTASAGGLNIFA